MKSVTIGIQARQTTIHSEFALRNLRPLDITAPNIASIQRLQAASIEVLRQAGLFKRFLGVWIVLMALVLFTIVAPSMFLGFNRIRRRLNEARENEANELEGE
jgi:hypothetical protein